MDRRMNRLYDGLWLWNELGELCRLLQWPAAGALGIYAVWAWGTREPGTAAKLLAALAACAAFQALLRCGVWLSGTMTGRTARKIDKILFGGADVL